MYRMQEQRCGAPARSARPALCSSMSRPVTRASGLRMRHGLRQSETARETEQRRLRESLQVEERVLHIDSEEAFRNAMAGAGDKLVVVECASEEVCQTGFDEPEMQWKGDRAAALQPCIRMKHTFARTARECPDVLFFNINADVEDTAGLLDQLGVDCLPTVQFWRAGQKLWEHRGVAQMEQGVGEGVLFYGDAAGDGIRGSDWVTELHGASDLQAFITPQPGESDKMLTVVDFSTSGAAGCVRVYPAVLALARSFKGYAKFARLMGDENAETQQLMGQYGVVEVPTFVFFKHGQEVGRHVGSSRGDLIGRILEVQQAFGVAPPPPPPREAKARQTARARA